MVITDNIMDGFSHFSLLGVFTHRHDLELKFIDVAEANTHAWTEGTNNCQYLN